MLIDNRNRLDLESKVLAAAFKQGIDHGDLGSADLAHKALFRLIKERHGTLPPVRANRAPSRPQLPASLIAPGGNLLPVPLPDSRELQPKSVNPDNGHGLAPTTINKPQAQLSKDQAEGEEASTGPPTPINVYELLAVPPTSPTELIHKNFLKQVRKVLVAKTKTKGVYPRKSLEMLRNLWIAHDILTDESIRADYDLNVLGLTSVANPDRSKSKEPLTLIDEEDAASLRLGELLRAAGLIDQTELEIACDMHKAMREMPFGRFLVKQDFIEEDQLEAVLLGQRFLREGLIDLKQFQLAMETFTRSSKDLDQILVEKGYATRADLLKVHELIRSEHQPSFSEEFQQNGSNPLLPQDKSVGGNGSTTRDEQHERRQFPPNARQPEPESKNSLTDNNGLEMRVIDIALSEFEEPS
jgi:hypothetical protein